MHGWNKWRKEGIKEIKRLIEAANHDRATAARVLPYYLDVYSKGKETELERYSDLNPEAHPENKSAYDNFQKSVLTLKSSLKHWLPKHYKSVAGKKARYQLYIVERPGMPLLLGVRDAWETTTKIPTKRTSLEKQKFEDQALLIEKWRQKVILMLTDDIDESRNLVVDCL